MNHQSIKTYHELASTMPISFAPQIAADIQRDKLLAKKAVELKARNKAYHARMRQDTTPGDRVVTK